QGLLQQPRAGNRGDARAIRRAWEERSDRILMVGFQPDFSAESQAAKKIVDTGALGDIYYAEAVTHRRWNVPGGNFVKKATAGAGTLVDTGVYAIHTALWLMGDPKPVSVSAITGSPLIKGYKGVKQTFAGPWSAAEADREASWTAKMRNFAEAVRDGKPSPIDPRGVFLVNVVMDGILRSAAARHEVKVSAEY